MKSRPASSKKCVSKECDKEVVDNRMGGEVVPGDVIWVKLRGGSWWPAQVVDENIVSQSNKPDKSSAGDVLGRLYGSYEYVYVDPIKCCSEFEIVLKQHNGSYCEIFQKALEQDCPQLKSGRLKGQGSKSKANQRGKVTQKQVKENQEIRTSNCKELQTCEGSVEEEASEGRKEDKVQKKVKPNSSSSTTILLGKSQELSARRMKVMKSLGLIAPPGSPFHKNGDIYLSM